MFMFLGFSYGCKIHIEVFSNELNFMIQVLMLLLEVLLLFDDHC